MQYLLSEVRGQNSSLPGEAKAFSSLPDLVKYLQKINKNKQLLVGEKLANADTLEELLRERLSTVSISIADEERTWIITAF